MKRSTDVEFFNRVINDESVKQWVSLGVKGDLDAAVLILNPDNIFIANEHGGFLLINNGNGLYELHTQFLPEGRGAKAVEAAVESLEYLFVQTDCIAIRTFIQDENLAAKRLARWMKFVPIESGLLNGFSGKYYLLTIKQWAQEFKKCQ